jgi:hypothetical protein
VCPENATIPRSTNEQKPTRIKEILVNIQYTFFWVLIYLSINGIQSAAEQSKIAYAKSMKSRSIFPPWSVNM